MATIFKVILAILLLPVLILLLPVLILHPVVFLLIAAIAVQASAPQPRR